MGDLGRVVAHDQQPGARQPVEHRGRLLAALALRDQLRQRDAPSGVLRRLAQLGEPEEQLAASAPAPARLEPQEDLLGRVGDRPPHTAGLEVARSGQDTTAPGGPTTRRGRGRAAGARRAPLRRRRASCRPSRRSSRSPAARSGTLDRPAQLVRLHRPEQELMRGQRRGQARMLGAASVEVRAEGDHDGGGSRLVKLDQGSEEATSARFVRAERERLLELVDDEERRRTVGRASVSAPSPGPSPASSPRRRLLEPGERPGSSPAPTRDDFPLPDAPTTAMNPPARSCPTRGRHDLLAPEEQVSILRLERHQPAIGACAGPRRDGQPGRDEHPCAASLAARRGRPPREADRRSPRRSLRRPRPAPEPASSRSRAAADGHVPPVACRPGLRLSRGRGHARVESARELAGGVEAILGRLERRHQRPVVAG